MKRLFDWAVPIAIFIAVVVLATLFFGWQGALLTVVTSVFLVVLVIGAYSFDLIVKVEEGYAIITKKGGKYHKTLWNFKGRAELDHGVILRQEELYSDETFSSRIFKMSDQTVPALEDDAREDFVKGKELVWYKYRLTKRFPYDSITLDKSDVTVTESSRNPIQNGSRSFSRSEVFLAKEYNRVSQDFDLSLEAIVARIQANQPGYTSDFFNKVDKGFFFVDNGQRFFISNVDTVIAKTIQDVPRSGRIVNLDHGDNRLFGGFHWVGLPPFFTVHEYHFKWVSLLPNGNPFEDEKKRQRGIYLGDDIYVVSLKGAEDQDLLPLDFDLLVKARIVDPRLSQFAVQKWLENVSAIAGALYRQLIAKSQFQRIIQERSEKGEDWWKVFLTTICDPVGEEIERRYGVRVLVVEIWKVQVGGGEKAKERFESAQAERWVADQNRLGAIAEAEGDAQARITRAKGEAEAIVIEANAQAQAIEKVFGKAISFGEQGVQLQMIEAIKQASTKQGNWVIPYGIVERFLSNVGGSSGAAMAEDLKKTLEKLQSTGEKTNTLLASFDRQGRGGYRGGQRGRRDDRGGNRGQGPQNPEGGNRG